MFKTTSAKKYYYPPILLNLAARQTSPDNARVLRECDICEELLTQYIDAGNRLIDHRKQFAARPEKSVRPKSENPIEIARRQRSLVYKKLQQHYEEHR